MADSKAKFTVKVNNSVMGFSNCHGHQILCLASTNPCVFQLLIFNFKIWRHNNMSWFISFFLRYVQTLRKFFTPFPDKDDFPIFSAEGTHEVVKLPDKILHLTDPLLVPSFSNPISRLLFSTVHRHRIFRFTWWSTGITAQVSTKRITFPTSSHNIYASFNVKKAEVLHLLCGSHRTMNSSCQQP